MFSQVVRQCSGLCMVRHMRHGLAVVAAVMMPLSASCGQVSGAGSASSPGASPSPVPVPADAEGPFPVSRVIDGDTMSVLKDGRQVKVRMLGLDTPETQDRDCCTVR